MNFLDFIRRVFPGEHRGFNFFYGFSLGLAIMPHPNWLSKSAWLAVYGTLMVTLGLCLYFARPKERFISPNGWRALGLAASGILFRVLSVFDWLVFPNNPTAMILAGGIVLLFCVILAL